ncbi:hypothetical protein [Streptomyces sp. NPDC047028]|uniref:hypothetical protein n=1 Tax=Streptomyces sp. NPDC047028 TaxID=3155793 RepID=UPI0033F41615
MGFDDVKLGTTQSIVSRESGPLGGDKILVASDPCFLNGETLAPGKIVGCNTNKVDDMALSLNASHAEAIVTYKVGSDWEDYRENTKSV